MNKWANCAPCAHRFTRKWILRTVLIAFSALAGGQASAALDDPNAEVVHLKKNCGTLANCTSSVLQLNNWIRDTRRPNETNPLVVNIGPGTFSDRPLSLACDGTVGFRGYISFIGAGIDVTILDAQKTHWFGALGTCNNLNFSALSLKSSAPPGTVNAYAVIAWSSGGSSQWANVGVEGSAYAWREDSCEGTGQHYWHSSRLRVTSSTFTIAVVYGAGCDESWFFGSELFMMLPPNDPAAGNSAVARASKPTPSNMGILHFYGSVLRTGTDASNGMLRGIAADGGEVHLHGVGMDFVSASGIPVVALEAENGGHIHGAATAYSVHTSGAFTRELIGDGGGTIDAPYFWGARPASLLDRVYSVDGEDTAIDTAAADGKPHSLVYRSSCGRRWYD